MGDFYTEKRHRFAFLSIITCHVFISPDEHELECLEQCLLQRMQFGQGECFLEIGVGEGQDPGLSSADIAASVVTAEALAKKLDARLILLRDRHVQPTGKQQQQHLQPSPTDNTQDGTSSGEISTSAPHPKGRNRRKNQRSKEPPVAEQVHTENELTEEMQEGSASVTGTNDW
ncbi:unnamed protein product, partial [Dibothriocephalus latus]